MDTHGTATPERLWSTAQLAECLGVPVKTSADRIESILRLHVYPLLGERRIAAVRPSDIQAWAKRLLTEHRLAPSTVTVVHGVLASMFKSAVRDRMVAASPCEGTRLPENHRQPVVPLAVEQVLALEAAMPARWRAMVPLGAAAGPRVSEALGLTVDRIGLKPPSAKPTLRIDRQLVVRQGEPAYLGPPKRKCPSPGCWSTRWRSTCPLSRPCLGRWSVATRPAGPGPRSWSSCSRPRGASR